MALIAMCVYDTEENQRSEYTNKTLQSLAQRDMKEYNDLIDKYRNGELDVYYEDKI